MALPQQPLPPALFHVDCMHKITSTSLSLPGASGSASCHRFRENIFSDKSGALGTFAASQEFAFSTIVQRTMDTPGNVRMHYGHPDVFNKVCAIWPRLSNSYQTGLHTYIHV